MGIQTFFPTIAQSASVSENVSLGRAAVSVGVWLPVVTSCAMFVQGGFETTNPTSALMARIQDPRSQSAVDWTANISTGSKGIIIREVMGFPTVRFETGIPQADVRTLAVHVQY